MSVLSLEQARFFRDTGYFKLTGVLNPLETAELRDFVDAEKTREAALAQSAGRSASAKMYGLYDRNPSLMDRLITHPNLIEPLQSLLGPNVVFVKNRHNHATINDKEGTKAEARLHRDILQPTRGLITAAVYLEESTIDNGCTHVIPTSHNFHYVGIPQADGGGTWMDEHNEYAGLLEQAVPIPMSEGSVLLFNGLAFHSVGLNVSDRVRRSITLGFRSADELEIEPDMTRQIIVAGSHTYRGNDR